MYQPQPNYQPEFLADPRCLLPAQSSSDNVEEFDDKFFENNP